VRASAAGARCAGSPIAYSLRWRDHAAAVGAIAGDRVDFIVQKTTEWMTRIIPVLSARGMVKPRRARPTPLAGQSAQRIAGPQSGYRRRGRA